MGTRSFFHEFLLFTLGTPKRFCITLAIVLAVLATVFTAVANFLLSVCQMLIVIGVIWYLVRQYWKETRRGKKTKH
jgi:hypothetical protein